MNGAQLIAAALLVPAAGAAGIALAGRRPNLRESATLATAATLLVCVLGLLPLVLAGERPQLVLLEMLPGITLGFRLEPLGMLFALVASSLWIVNSVYSIGYMRGNNEPQQTRFYVCFALALAATMGIAFSANLLTLYLFYELLTLVTWPLVTHHGDGEARAGGRTYLGFLLGTSIVLLLPAIIVTWAFAGTLDFAPGGILRGAGLSNAALGGLLALYMFGIGKAALMPFHRWLPAAMVAPTPVSALLHAVAVVKAGVFTVLKVIVYVFGVETLAEVRAADWLPTVAGFTIIAASVVALRSDNLKRRLAYSTVSQLSYVVLAASLLAPLSVAAAALHIATHAVGKITLFFAAGAIYTASHKTEVSQLDGIGRRMPWTMGAFAIGALSLIGIPPTAGFLSKWMIFQGAAAAGHHAALAVLALSTLLNAAYFLPIVHAAFLREPRAGGGVHGEAPKPMLAALVLTALATLALPFVAAVPLALARAAAGIGT
ncbi:MAG: monovalent cation/H+ antiporter subunit D family protein [Betaproteobacteria bacterium]|nr:MAG: monovalent cation/H+ antiporter subunit D family protein [Betaproteobacteria bacterium]